MKECAWCGMDFRGKAIEHNDEKFCTDDCRDEYRVEELGDSPEVVAIEAANALEES